jgi:retron-type reverse transcriptase
MNGNPYLQRMIGIPAVKDLQSLSDQTHLSKALLFKLSKCNDKFYKHFELPKRGGGSRTISCPAREMKAVQAWILRRILERVSVADAATAYIPGKNILQNLRPHKGNRYFLCMDIEDFFPSITYPKIYTIFKTLGYNPHVAHIFTSLCTCDDRLPQGSVTSPALSNIVCIRMDHRISAYAGKRNIAYTRYADDMTFSSKTPSRLISVHKVVAEIVQSEGYRINEDKTRFMGPRRRRKITGLVVSDENVGVGRSRKRILRAALHALLTKPLADEEKSKLRYHLGGWLAYMKDVDVEGFGQLRRYTHQLAQKYKLQIPLPLIK